MRSRTHLDRRRRLQPRDYAAERLRFGVDPDLVFRVPDGGDEVSCRLARLQHRLICRWRAQGGPSGAELARRWGASKQTWSRTVLGERWAGETLLAALLTIPDRPRSASPDRHDPTPVREP